MTQIQCKCGCGNYLKQLPNNRTRQYIVGHNNRGKRNIIVEPGYKYCGKCKNILSITNFAKNKIKKDGLQERCKKCRSNHYTKLDKSKIKKLTKEQRRKSVIKSYGITIQEFENLLLKQTNTCAICKSDNWGRSSPSIDHDHLTGKVRGLLCNNCNRVIRLLGDSINIIEMALNYLKEFYEKQKNT